MYFATCQWNPYGKQFLQQLYPSIKIEDLMVQKLIELMNQDILRIEDPNYHQPCQIIQGEKYKPEHNELVQEAMEEFQENVHNINE